MQLDDQSKVDYTVDALRSADISIAGITKRKRSLEELFLDIVGTTNEERTK
jgi:hypothetical protein